MAAAQHNLLVSRAADFGFQITIRESDNTIVDVSADTFTAQIRRAPKQPLVASFICESVISGASGIVSCILPKSETLKLDGHITYYWDLFWLSDSSGLSDKLIKGTVKVEDNVTNI
jgi:hypothetical protein